MSNKYAVLLVRVSTQIQDYEPQIEDLKRFAKSRGYNNFHIIETKESGLVDFEKKVGANKLFKFITDNPDYKSVFATEISRLGRRQSVLHQIKEWFVKNKVQFYTKDTGYSLLDETGKPSPSGDMMFTLYGFFAESEIKQKKDRFIRARKLLMEQGLSISGKTLFGYERTRIDSGKTTLTIHKDNAAVVRTIFNWYLNGISQTEKNVSVRRITLECIKRGFDKYTHSKRNVNKLLKEEGYTGGKITNNKKKNLSYTEGGNEEPYVVSNYRIKYPVIVDSETFNLVQERLLKSNSNVDKSSKHITILSKLLVCSSCKGHYIANYRAVGGVNRSTYRCGARHKAYPCKNKQSISMSLIDGAVWGLIKTDLVLLSKAISKHNPNKDIAEKKHFKKELEKEIEAMGKEEDALMQSLNSLENMRGQTASKFIATLSQKVSKIQKETDSLKDEIAKIDMSLSVKNADFKGVYKTIKDNIEVIEQEKDLLKEYINLFVDEIEITLHSPQFSIIRVKIKDTVRLGRYNAPNDLKDRRYFEDELESYMSIILDKRNSKLISAYKTFFPIFKGKIKNTIQMHAPEIKDGGYINTKFTSQEFELYLSKKYYKKFDFVKLNVYHTDLNKKFLQNLH